MTANNNQSYLPYLNKLLDQHNNNECNFRFLLVMPYFGHQVTIST